MNPLDRAARERELDAVTELQRVNLSSENRFEASPLRGNSTVTGTFRRHLGVLVRNGRYHSMVLWGVVLVGMVRVAGRCCRPPSRLFTSRINRETRAPVVLTYRG